MLTPGTTAPLALDITTLVISGDADNDIKDPDELLLLAEKIPDMIRNRVLQRPDAFRRIATLDDRRLDEVLEFLEKEGQ